MNKSIVGFWLLTAMMFFSPSAKCQDQGGVPAKSTTTPTTMMGCVVRGDIVDRYKFTTKNGKTWDLVTSMPREKMNPYVGHRVTVRGTITPNPYSQKDKEDAGALKRDVSKNNAGTLTVDKFLKTGEVCSQ